MAANRCQIKSLIWIEDFELVGSIWIAAFLNGWNFSENIRQDWETCKF